MTPQEKIQQLAAAALRSAPPAGSVPKPVTYMAPFEKPKAKETPVAKPKPKPDEAPAREEAVTAAPSAEAPAKSFLDQPDPELRAMIEEREEQISKKWGRQSLALTLSLLALLAGGGVWYSNSPAAQASVAKLIPTLKKSVDDVKMIGSITSQYDESLEKIGEHGKHIDDATRALGIDPTTVSKEENQSIEAEMQKFMGEDGVTTGARDRKLQEKFGFVQKLIGNKSDDAAPAEAQP